MPKEPRKNYSSSHNEDIVRKVIEEARKDNSYEDISGSARIIGVRIKTGQCKKMFNVNTYQLGIFHHINLEEILKLLHDVASIKKGHPTRYNLLNTYSITYYEKQIKDLNETINELNNEIRFMNDKINELEEINNSHSANKVIQNNPIQTSTFATPIIYHQYHQPPPIYHSSQPPPIYHSSQPLPIYHSSQPQQPTSTSIYHSSQPQQPTSTSIYHSSQPQVNYQS